MDDLTCLGCVKSFATQKRLSSHEAQCAANKTLDTDIYKSQQHLEKEKCKKQKWRRLREVSRSPTLQEKTPPAHNLPPVDEQMDIDDGWYNTGEVKNDASGPSNAGPSSIVSDPLVDSTVSVCSGMGIYFAHMAHQARNQPSVPSASPPLPQEEPGTPPAAVQDQPTLVPYKTQPDSMGLFRIYAQHPTLILIGNEGLDVIADAPTFETQGNSHLERSQIIPGLPSSDIWPEDIFSAFSSPTPGLLFCWQYSGSNSKSNAEMKCLASDFLDDDEYRREDARAYDTVCEKRLIQDYLKDRSNPFHMENGWRCSSVNIRLPKEKEKFASEEEAPEMEIPGVYHRSLTDIIVSVVETRASHSVIWRFTLGSIQHQLAASLCVPSTVIPI
ncbi:uncharacterized protein F5891DRAFT_1191719 [Suillus fuscotomentosus]|uniref:Uncharacterized protein n=1 Tax=Suillus fuscotomentosus TaxID=1912939 RepID=A0AAD4E0L0_9AGAM|nr:uncharacterized protein F5891DRAFT_1191719 [Suillus fuscotomentosus]KAG1897520.1 hypothetical protein F5891DRAFT_1191719 [Suillus fuscotomentosus]